ncbi:hypothetical protein CCGE525_11355 [Rhizobium jaguaris]|uniref:Uncharacterized protein n=1 Tax=Rhizobium jaguaris TaxID=1312183 RepID=A0A387FJ32_9HYPH|nr:hypothetical protein CCGE525_11355 [Rhizobium jaguaris]
MSRKSAPRFCDNDMRKIRKLKRRERIPEIAMRFSRLRNGMKKARRKFPPCLNFFALQAARSDAYSSR